MGYFRAVEAVSRPYSFPVVSAESYERGSFLWFDKALATGKATTVLTGNVALGICDDEKTSNLTGKIVDQLIATTATLTLVTGVTVTYSLGRVCEVLAPTAIGSLPEFALQIETAVGSGVYAPFSVTSFGATDATATIAIAADGTVTFVFGASDADLGAWGVKLTLSYTYTRTIAGAAIVSDMFNNNSTEASSLVTVWFMDGIYETDQFDPYAATAYAVGGTAYAKTGGLFTSVTGSNTIVGIIAATPQANYTAETKTVNGHAKPRPESLRLLMRLPRP